MSDPTRWLHARSDADPVERQLLESLRREGPDEADRGALWQQLAASAALAGLTAVAAPTAASGALATAGASKGGFGAALASLVPKALAGKVVLATVLAGAGVGGFVALGHEPRAPAPHSQVARAVPVAQVPVAPVADAQIVPPAAIEPALPPTAPHRVAARATRQGERLLQESRLLTEARSALRAGDLSQALLLLRRLTNDFPRGELLQERQVLLIETLAQRGDTTRARKLAAAFMEKHPNSPHNLTLRRFLDAP